MDRPAVSPEPRDDIVDGTRLGSNQRVNDGVDLLRIMSSLVVRRAALISNSASAVESFATLPSVDLLVSSERVIWVPSDIRKVAMPKAATKLSSVTSYSFGTSWPRSNSATNNRNTPSPVT